MGAAKYIPYAFCNQDRMLLRVWADRDDVRALKRGSTRPYCHCAGLWRQISGSSLPMSLMVSRCRGSRNSFDHDRP